jgi:hypothetical protein
LDDAMRTEPTSWRTMTALCTVFSFSASFVFGAAYQEPPGPTPTPGVRESKVRIEHDPLGCVTSTIRPVVDSKMLPGEELSKGYVYFRKTGTPYFYYVRTSGVVPDQRAKLPRPLPETKNVDYYVQATDRAAMSRKTKDFFPPVTPPDQCSATGTPMAPAEEGLTIGLTDPKAPPIPEGFNKDDIAKIILVTGAVVTLAVALSTSGGAAAGTAAGAATAGSAGGGSGGAAAGAGAGGAAGGGGISSTALIVGGVAVAAGVGIGVGLAGKKSTPAPSPTPTPGVVVNHFVEVDAVWSGIGDVNVTLLDPNGQSVGTVISAGCDATGISRTERVVLQGTTLAAGSYHVTLTGVSCGPDTPQTIDTVVTVLTDSVPKCSSAFVNVPVGGNVDGCTFTLP